MTTPAPPLGSLAARSDRPTAKSAATRAYPFLAIVMLTWAGNAIVGRAVRADIPPFTLAFARWCGALVLMAPFVARPLLRDRAVLVAHWRLLVLFGLLGIACFNGFLYLGLHYTTATNAILLQAAIPPMILVANFALFRERAGALQIVGVILSTLGVVLVVAHADPQILLHLRFSRGDVFVLCGVIGWSIYTALLRVRPPLDPRSFLAATFLVGALAMLPLAAWEWAAGKTIAWHATTLAAFGYVAVFPSLIGYLLYNISVGMIGAARAGQTVTMMPLFGAFLAAVLLGEPLRAYHFAGVALILAGIALSALSARRASA